MSLQLKVTSKSYAKLIFLSIVYVHPRNFEELCSMAVQKPDSPEVQSRGIYASVKGVTFNVKPNDEIDVGYVYCNKAVRSTISVPLNVDVCLIPVTNIRDITYLRSLTLEIGYMITSEKKKRTLDCDAVVEYLRKNYTSSFFNRGQIFFFKLALPEGKIKLRASVRDVEALSTQIVTGKDSGASAQSSNTNGILQPETEIKFIKCPQHALVLENTNQNQGQDMFSMQELSFSSMGIGGLDGQFSEIFRRAFASRLFPADYMKKLGLTHVKGILMHGPPGCGKTLIARQLSKALKVCSEKKHIIE